MTDTKKVNKNFIHLFCICLILLDVDEIRSRSAEGFNYCSLF